MKNKVLWIFLLLLAFYFGLNLFHLTALPVFADESIYIRWSQLIIDDFHRYLFYPMNDGKTPLLMWLMVPALKNIFDQLWAGRLVSVLIGAISVSFVFLILRQLKEKKAALLGMFLAIISPFLFFYNRLALTDGLLFANLLISYYFTLKIVQSKKIWPILPLAVFFFLSIMSKTPALLFMPVFYLAIFLADKLSFKVIIEKGIKISIGLLLAGLGFYSLRVVPLFTQLFAVGGNFLQDKSVILSAEIWSIAWRNLQFFFEQLVTYLTPFVLIMALPWFTKTRKKQSILLLSGLAFILPLALVGKIIYPRYILPSSLFFILSVAISLKNLGQRSLLKYLIIVLIGIQAATFISNAYFNVDQLALTAADREQFLESWSSGHGISETVEFIEEIAKDKKVAVATEGYFGTLPDGILLNLHNRNVDNIYVEGIGQPVREISKEFLERAKDFDVKLLVVNSYRLEMNMDDSRLLKSYCRPNNKPCLEVWEMGF